MSIKDYISKFRKENNTNSQDVVTNNDEKTKAVRMLYVHLETFYQSCTNYLKVGRTLGLTSPFGLPNGMTYEDAYKVISFISEKVEAETNIGPCSEASVGLTSKKLADYGFKKQEASPIGHFHDVSSYVNGKYIFTYVPAELKKGIDLEISDLYSISGDEKLFERSDIKSRYFEWFTEGVKAEEVKEIYDRIGQPIDDNLLTIDDMTKE